MDIYLVQDKIKTVEYKLLSKLPASLTDDMFNKRYETWVKERDLIAIKSKKAIILIEQSTRILI